MKKCLKPVLFLISITISLSLPAQVHFGLRAGVLSSSANFSETTAGQTIKNRTGVLGSLVTEIRINEGFAIQPEVSWAQRGWKNSLLITIPFLGSSETIYSEQINYLEIPVMAKAGFSAGPARLDIIAGPSFAWAINGKQKTTTINTSANNQTSTNSAERDLDFDEDFQKADFGLQGGLVLSANLGSARVFFDGRYLYGIKDLSRDEDIKITSKGVALSAGVLFGF